MFVRNIFGKYICDEKSSVFPKRIVWCGWCLWYVCGVGGKWGSCVVWLGWYVWYVWWYLWWYLWWYVWRGWYVADKGGIGIGGSNTHTSQAAARKKGLFNPICAWANTDTVQ